MNIFKKVFQQNSKTLIKSTAEYDLFSTENSSSFIYKNKEAAQRTISILKTLKHQNIINIIKYKPESIKTDKLYPISPFYKDSLHFIYHTLFVLSDVIIFLKRCNISHNRILFDNVYYSDKIVLAGFENYSKVLGEDEFSFLKLIERARNDIGRGIFVTKSNNKLRKDAWDFTHESTTKNNIENMLDCDYDSVEEFNERNKKYYLRNIYKILEDKFLKFNILKQEEKEMFVDFIEVNSDEWIEVVKIRIIELFMNELNGSNEYKNSILTMIFNLNAKEMNVYLEKLFVLPDSQIRLFLLKNYDFYSKLEINWNKKIFENLLNGIRCSDSKLKYESLTFIDKISANLNDKNMKELLKNIGLHINDDIQVKYCISFFRRNINRLTKEVKELYKTLLVFLKYEDSRKETIELISDICDHFEIKKMQTELLPIICTFLSDQELQDVSFVAIDKMIRILKENKNNLVKEEWSLKGMTKAVSNLKFTNNKTKNEKKEASIKDVKKTENTKKGKDNSDSGWDDEW